jgi:hypothetical protein
MEISSEQQFKLLDISLAESLHTQVCSDCLRQLKGIIGNPGQFRQKQNINEAHKQALWASRGDLLKRAQAALDDSHWAQAAKNYEAYIQVLETIFEQKPGQLAPDAFRAMNKIEEMKTLVLVYWELIQIHDGKNERMVDAYSQKLAKFGQCSPLKMSLLEKIREYEPKSVFKKYIRRADRELRGEKGLFSIFKAS